MALRGGPPVAKGASRARAAVATPDVDPVKLAAIGLMIAVCIFLAMASQGPGYLIGGAAVEHPVLAADPRLESSFAAHMTTDDVARGVYALSGRASSDAVALTPEQRAAIHPLLVEGAALRARLGNLREARRAARARLITRVELP